MCTPIRTRTSTPSGQRCDASARCALTAAAIASLARAKATKNASPSVWTSRPSCSSNAARSSALMLGEHLGVAAAQPRQQPRRTLDVAEQERDGATRKLRHTRSYAQSPPPVKSCHATTRHPFATRTS